MKSLKIAILSAHEGGGYWSRLVERFNLFDEICFKSMHYFSDSEYRKPKSLYGSILLRIKIYLIYPVRCFFIILFHQNSYDAFLVISSPFFLPTLCVWLSRKPVIILLNDIYPEALVLSGVIPRNSIITFALTKLCSKGIVKASAVVYICDSHREFSEASLAVNPAAYVVPVGASGFDFRDCPPTPVFGLIKFMYCGTLGLMHDYETMLTFFETRMLSDNIQFVFLTSGAGKRRFEKRLRANNRSLVDRGGVILGDSLSYESWVSRMKSSQIGIVFQGHGAENVIFPSKIFSILMSGQAVLAIADPECELGRLINRHDCGWVIKPGDLYELERAFKESEDCDILLRKRSNAYFLGHNRFDTDMLAVKWKDILVNACALKAG